MFIQNGILSEQCIADFEVETRLNLPNDYRIFLCKTNGGTFQDSIIKPQRPGELLIDCLFGLSGKSETDLRFWRGEFDGEIPEKSLIIGSDAGGGFLLLCLEKDAEGIYYYDHSYFFPASSDSENTYFIYPSFSALFSELNKSFQA